MKNFEEMTDHDLFVDTNRKYLKLIELDGKNVDRYNDLVEDNQTLLKMINIANDEIEALKASIKDQEATMTMLAEMLSDIMARV